MEWTVHTKKAIAFYFNSGIDMKMRRYFRVFGCTRKTAKKHLQELKQRRLAKYTIGSKIVDKLLSVQAIVTRTSEL